MIINATSYTGRTIISALSLMRVTIHSCYLKPAWSNSNLYTLGSVSLTPFPLSPHMYCCPSAPQPSKLVQNKILLPCCILIFLFQSCCCTSVCSAYILPPACHTSQHSSHPRAQLMILQHHFPMHFLTCLLLFHVDYIILSSHCP